MSTLSAATHSSAGSRLNSKEDDPKGPLLQTDVLSTTHAYTQTPIVQPHIQYPLLLIHPSVPCPSEPSFNLNIKIIR